jgi:aminoglycoside 6'-N-acetyltransferase
MAPDYRFRPMTRGDLPLINRWLALPHVRQWWGDPEEQYALVRGDLDEPAMDQHIVSTAGNSFAYLQCYDLTAWNSGFGPQPEGTRGIDLFIGEPDMIERGHGQAFIPACNRAHRASSPIQTLRIRARSVPTRRQDSKRTAWSIRQMARPC